MFSNLILSDFPAPFTTSMSFIKILVYLKIKIGFLNVYNHIHVDPDVSKISTLVSMMSLCTMKINDRGDRINDLKIGKCLFGELFLA